MAKEVIVRILGDTQREPSPDASSSSGRQTPSAEAKEGKTQSGKGDVLKAVGVYAAKKVWSTLKAEAKYTVGKYFVLTEDYKAEMAVENTLTTMDGLMDMITAYGVGSALGGPLGSVVAMAATATSKILSSAHRYGDATQSIIENAYGNYFYGTRAGFVGGGHGTEN